MERIQLIDKNLQYHEAKMLQTIEELGIEKGIEVVLLNIMKSGLVNIDQIVKLTGIGADYRFSHKDFGKAPDQNYPQAYNSTLRTNFYLGT